MGKVTSSYPEAVSTKAKTMAKGYTRITVQFTGQWTIT
jgi:hypothetical protein